MAAVNITGKGGKLNPPTITINGKEITLYFGLACFLTVFVQQVLHAILLQILLSLYTPSILWQFQGMLSVS